MNRITLILLVSVALVASSSLYVRSGGEDFDDCGSQESPCATIQYAVTLATNSNESYVSIILDGHLFTGIDNTNISIANTVNDIKPNIEIVGQYSDTTINCGGNTIGFFTNYKADNTSLYSSVTFQNLIFSNCYYYENKTQDSFIQRGGGAIQILDTDAQIVNCKFRNCNGIYGGAINVGSPSVIPFQVSVASGIVINSTFVNNYGIYKGGAIYVNRDSTLVVIGSSFVNNNAHDGGAIHSTSGQVFSHTYILESTFNSNWAEHAGGALHIEMPAAVANCSFFNNSANIGGAIFGNYLDNYEQQIAVLNGNFSENYAMESGGAIYFTYTEVNMSNCNVDHNSAPNAGGIYIENSNKVYIYNSSIFENSGVGLYLNSTSAYLNGSSLVDNDGGNLFDSNPQLTCSCVTCEDCGNIGGCILDENTCTCFADSHCATFGTQSCAVKNEEFSCSCEENYSDAQCSTFSTKIKTGGGLITVIIAFFVVFGVILLCGVAGYLYRRKKRQQGYEAVPLVQ